MMTGMSEDDQWYRSAEWDSAAQEEFERRLARARSWNRPQYLRIKAISLLDADLREAAKALWERILTDPEANSMELAGANEKLANLARSEGDIGRAEELYREVLRRWPSLDGTSDQVDLSLAELLCDRGEYHEALTFLDTYAERCEEDGFDSTWFRWHVIRVRIAQATGDDSTVQASARTALDLASRGPEFSRHPDVGLVHADDATLSWLWSIAK